MIDKISSPGLVKKHSTHVQGLAILFSFIKYASYVMKYAHVKVVRTMRVD